ncbi:MAG: hypothetical protein O2854_02285 [Chloroflexi bacterium]|nr:hypothetical protein [Chloroflexota bacterium]
MRRLKDVYPEYQDSVAFYAVSIDPTESIEELDSYRAQQEYTWSMATAGRGLLAELNVRVQSTKIAFGSDGIITYRAGYGSGSVDEWTQVFEDLSER